MSAALLAGCVTATAATRSRPQLPRRLSRLGPVIATTTTAKVTAQSRLDDGSFGSQAVRKACTLLTRREIAAQLGGPVGPPTPAFPSCEWLVGKRSFLALTFEPGVAFSVATRWVSPLQVVPGLGSRALIANNRYLYFGSKHATFSLLWQKVGDFTNLHEKKLVALARDVLSHPVPPGRLGPPKPVPEGPAVYFAGDSTAAGPEWAWVTYHAAQKAISTLAEYQVGSGLVVPAYFDWPRHLLAVTAEERPKLVVYMGSANDGQELPYENGYAAVGSPAWRRVYGARVGHTMSELTKEGAKVLWVGEPAMQQPQLSRYMLAMDEVCRAEAKTHPGVTFFNPGSVLNLPGWRYTPFVVIGGQDVSVRLDGIHLNMAGSLFLADKLAPLITALLRAH
jgi:hypothetical protein